MSPSVAEGQPEPAPAEARYASLRLSALLTSPSAFAPTFPGEAVLTAAQWQTRLTRPGFEAFICVRHPASIPESELSIEKGEWVGTVVILGPQEKKTYELPQSGGPILGTDEEETRWQLTSLYADPAHRGKGLAKQLVNVAVKFAKSYKPPTVAPDPVTELMANGVQTVVKTATGAGRDKPPRPTKARVRLMSSPDNEKVLGMYRYLGFQDAGRATLAEAMVSNGDANQLPEDRGASDPG